MTTPAPCPSPTFLTALQDLVSLILCHPACDTARYVTFRYDWPNNLWVPTRIADVAGSWIIGPNQIGAVIPPGTYTTVLAAIDPATTDPVFHVMTLDLAAVAHLHPGDWFYYTVAEYALNDPALPVPWLAEWLSCPIDEIRAMVWGHPNLPDYLRAIICLSR